MAVIRLKRLSPDGAIFQGYGGVLLKGFFIVMLLAFLVGSYGILTKDDLNAGDAGQFVNSIFFLIALYGYAFKKAIIHRYFAIAIFAWNTIGYLVVTGFLIFLIVSSSGESFKADSMGFFVVGYSVISFLMYVMFMYAFRSPDIWRKKQA